MASLKPEIRIFITPKDNQSSIEINTPRKVEVKSGFGAEIRQCWLEFYLEDTLIPVGLGDSLEVEVNQSTVFQGYITEKRIDSIDDQLSVVALLDPTRLWNHRVNGFFEDFFVTDLLEDVINGSSLTLDIQDSHPTALSSITFSNDSLFFVIDLLAKIAGNWYWSISDEGVLRVNKPGNKADHCISLKPDEFTVNIRENHNQVYSEIEVECGIRDQSSYEKVIAIPDVTHTAQNASTRVFVRPITTPDVFAALERAIIQHMTAPHYGHYVDLLGLGETIQPGDTVRFLVDDIPLFPHEQIFRVKQRDITYAHERLKTRLHLTTGYESAPGYFHHYRSDRPRPRLFLKGQVGPFQMDVSALDSQSKLDGV